MLDGVEEVTRRMKLKASLRSGVSTDTENSREGFDDATTNEDVEGEVDNRMNLSHTAQTRIAPCVVASAALDVYSESEVGAQLLPSYLYPSDHLAIAADFRISWDPVKNRDGAND